MQNLIGGNCTVSLMWVLANWLYTKLWFALSAHAQTIDDICRTWLIKFQKTNKHKAITHVLPLLFLLLAEFRDQCRKVCQTARNTSKWRQLRIFKMCQQRVTCIPPWCRHKCYTQDITKLAAHHEIITSTPWCVHYVTLQIVYKSNASCMLLCTSHIGL